MHDLLDPWHNPVTYAIPVFLLSIVIELAALKWLDHDDTLVASAGDRARTGYERVDARTSILMGAGSLVSTILLKAASFVLYVWIYEELAPFHLPTDLPGAWWSWALMILGVDFLYYWQHRFVHRARIGWAAHQAHHSSAYMNFATALRQKWNPWWELVFWLPLPFLGVSPLAIYTAWGINLVYQFFVHTETIDRLPRPIEWVFNTPSHHRVHHGSDPEYLDKNYAGILIVWDRLFGTFTAEVRRPTYGLTKPVTTSNLIKLEFGDYRALWTDVRGSSSAKEAIGWIFGPPGWAPEGKVPTPSSAVAAVPPPATGSESPEPATR
ncbi:MAG: sterol desaturase family protein [Nocardioides sp.]|uniref:sterol desaturase family protein n=1 Tax=Nocardioides sp. TaxID=35761 RepID=UPI0039E4D204